MPRFIKKSLTKPMDNKCKNCSVKQENIFKSLEEGALQKISACKSSLTVKKGSVIFQEGEHINGVYCIKEGVCKLTKLCPNGKSQIVRFVSKGSLLGQRSVVSQEPANLTATAIKDMKICFIPKERILSSFAEEAHFSSELLKDLCSDLRKADNFIVDMAQKNVKQRLADTLLRLENLLGTDSEGFIDVKLSREEIASVVGTATESLIRTLSEFAKNNYIQTQGKRIKIANRTLLQKLSQSV